MKVDADGLLPVGPSGIEFMGFNDVGPAVGDAQHLDQRAQPSACYIQGKDAILETAMKTNRYGLAPELLHRAAHSHGILETLANLYDDVKFGAQSPRATGFSFNNTQFQGFDYIARSDFRAVIGRTVPELNASVYTADNAFKPWGVPAAQSRAAE
ncbi:hypothetical protein B0H17DRAFT_1256191 [Mycena rosella]|uniref:Uncharacterized protein n=1 Tax=Mycena rosella TaxID=1033263 RepID=A0AAD7CV63_MYCRO|nr:hypothetical protein B0H17DRAFT_1256191 [Mycena rosella]